MRFAISGRQAQFSPPAMLQALRVREAHATKAGVTTGQGTVAPPESGKEFDSAWQELRADADIQFAPVELPDAPPQPDWLAQFLDWLGQLFAPFTRLLVYSWPVLMWVLIAAAVLFVAWLVYNAIDPGARRRRKGKAADDWVPEEQEALALLEEADRLAAAGDYDEATHLLLKRSVGQIAEARPDLVEPSSTARELACEPRLPDAARNAFALIAAPVERSLFALRRLEEGDWQAARSAYADFALAQKAIAR